MGHILNRRRVMGGSKELLPYDAKVEYIESNFTSGIPFILTGITETLTTRFVLRGFFTSTTSGRHGVSNANTSRFYFGCVNNKFAAGCNSTSYNHNIQDADNAIHTFSLGSDGFFIDGVKKMDSGNIATNEEIQIFYAANSITKGGVVSSQIYDDGILVRDYIAVRVGQAGYLYDKISKQLFGKAFAYMNDFIPGPDV